MSKVVRRMWVGTPMYLTSAGRWDRDIALAHVFPEELVGGVGGILSGLTNGQGEFIDAPRDKAWALQSMDGLFLSTSGWSLEGDVLLLPDEETAMVVLVAHVYKDNLDIVGSE